MRRREFVVGLGGVTGATMIPALVARSQTASMPAIGFLLAGSSGPLRSQITSFNQGLRESGFVDGQNIAVEYRWAEGRYDRLPDLAEDLLQRRVAVLVAAPTPSALAAKKATTTVPVVFITGVDPVEFGLVASFNRPEGNVTGVSFFTSELETKRLGLIHEVVPIAVALAAFINPNNPASGVQIKDLGEAARKLERQLHIIPVGRESEFEAAFGEVARLRAGGLLISADAFFNSWREQLAALALRHSVPTICEWREYADAGALMSYGTSISAAYRQAGIYAGRIVKGTPPAELPVIRSTRFEFVINLKTARSMGVQIPSGILSIADEVIE